MRFEGNISPIVESKLWTKVAWGIILFFVVLSFIAPFLSNENPIYIHDGKKAYWPIITHTNWQKICSDNSCKRLNTLIPFSPGTIDATAIYSPPLTRNKSDDRMHVLGTDQLGRDVLSALIWGSRTAVWVSMLAAGLAFFIGLLYGLLMGYYGNDSIRCSNTQLIGLLMIGMLGGMILLFINYAYLSSQISRFWLVMALLFTLLLAFMSMRMVAYKTPSTQSRSVSVDSIGMRLVDTVKALPPLFVVLFALQWQEASGIFYMVCLIAFLLWAGFARHSRAEVFRLRQNPSIKSALLGGRSDFWIWRYELLPYIIRPLLVILAFSMASAILLEATLSFLGLGLPAEHVSWGTLIDTARSRSSAWWLLFFPGLCMLSLIWSLQHLGRKVEEGLRNRQSLSSAD